jgi:hypothetical protein
VSKISQERQLGAFLFLFQVVLKTLPDLLPEKQVQFRNAVIHQGYLPSSSEVAGFGDRVMQIILANQDSLRAWAKGLDQLPQLHTLLRHRDNEVILSATETRPTILNTSGRRTLQRHDTFLEALENLKTFREMYIP